MTPNEAREHKDFKSAKEKVRSYPKDFRFTLDYSKIPTPQAKALMLLTQDCIKEGLLESVAMDLSLTGEIVAETFKRL